jgi:TonB family protein
VVRFLAFCSAVILAFLATLIVIPSTTLADSSPNWIQEKEQLLSNYRSLSNLKTSSLSPPENALVQGKYESNSEFQARLKKNQKKNIRRFFLESYADFSVPDDSSMVEFSYNPFESHIISEDIKTNYTIGENAFGAKSQMRVETGVRQVFQPNKFDLKWPSDSTDLLVSKNYLQKNNADVVIVRIVDIDMADPGSFRADWDWKRARRDSAVERDIREMLITGNVVAAGLYDKKNDSLIGVFSPSHDYFYYSYNKKLSTELASSKDRLDPDLPIYAPQPTYPRRAQTRGVTGYAVVEVVITTVGSVRDPILIEEVPEGYGFGRAAIKAASKLKYKPRLSDGVPQEVEGARYKFTFGVDK